MLAYAAASQYWRAIPLGMADWAWQRRGRMLIQRAARSVPAYSLLLQVFSDTTSAVAPFADAHRLQTCRRSYVDVFPLEQRCRVGWQRQAVAWNPAEGADGLVGPDEMQTLRQQLVGLLSGWFDIIRRRTLLVLSLPETGWAGRHRIGGALQEAIGRGQIRGAMADLADGTSLATVLRLADGFEQCVVLADASAGTAPSRWLSGYSGRAGLVAFGPLSAGVMAGLSPLSACCVAGACSVSPLVVLQTPLTRLISIACQADLGLRERLLPGVAQPLGLYQPFPRGPWIEEQDGQILISNWGISPLIRYRVGWRGRVVPFSRLCEQLRQTKTLSSKQIRQFTRIESICWKLPLVALTSV